jgi:hypothetical protein
MQKLAKWTPTRPHPESRRPDPADCVTRPTRRDAACADSDLSLVLVEWRVLVRVGWRIGRHIGQFVACDGKARGLLLGLDVNLGLEIVVVLSHGSRVKACIPHADHER